jgi:chemosensory pili system protein ChpA (sensor histidine kinase/response regulator)
MVEFEEFPIALPWFDRLEDTGKQVKLDLLGGTIEMDRGMLDRMTPALSICYATACPRYRKSGRARCGWKRSRGLITVLKHEGNDVSVDCDDAKDLT